jgi:hypothetical protein
VQPFTPSRICCSAHRKSSSVSPRPPAELHAALAVTEGLRIQLRAQNTHGPASSTEPSERLWEAVRRDPAKLHADMQALWDQASGAIAPIGRSVRNIAAERGGIAVLAMSSSAQVATRDRWA